MRGVNFPSPKIGLQADAPRERRRFLKTQTLLQGNIFAPQHFAIAFGLAKNNSRCFADHKCLAAETADFVGVLADFPFYVVFHDSHRRHHDDDGKDADQNAEQRERGA